MAIPTAAESGSGEDVVQLLYRGGELLAGGSVGEAKDYLEKAVQLSPENERGKNLLGLTYFKLGLFDRAAELYEGLVQANPADPTLRVNLGLVYLKTNALSRAIHEFATATDLAPDHHKAHNYLGLALAQAGQYEKARQHFVVAGSPAMAEKMAEALSREPVTAPASNGTQGAPAAPPQETATAVAPASESAAAPPVATAPVVVVPSENVPSSNDGADDEAAWEKAFSEGPTQPRQEPANERTPPPQPEPAAIRPAPVTLFPPPAAAPSAEPVTPKAAEVIASKLSELVRAVSLPGEAATQPFEIRPDAVLISVEGELLTRLSGLCAYRGSLELKSERKRFRGRLTDRSFGDAAEQVMRAKGTGTFVVDPKKRTFVATEIGGDSAYFREGAVFAFEGGLSFENGRLPSEMTPDLDLVYLRGNGQVLLCCAGPLRSVEISLARPATVPLEELVGWFGNLTPRISVLAYDEGGKVLRAGVELSGEGFVLFGAPLS